MPKKECPKSVGEVLKDLLEKKNMTQAYLAEKSGVHRTTISRIVNGHCDITPFTDKRLSRPLKVKSGYFINFENAWYTWHGTHGDKYDVIPNKVDNTSQFFTYISGAEGEDLWTRVRNHWNRDPGNKVGKWDRMMLTDRFALHKNWSTARVYTYRVLCFALPPLVSLSLAYLF